MRALLRVLGCLALGLTAGCAERAPSPPALDLRPAAMADLPGWAADDLVDLGPALVASCAVWGRKPADAPVGPGGRFGRAADWARACADLPTDPAALRDALSARFRAYALVARPGGVEGLFTGYYAPEIAGCRTAAPGCATSLYARPTDLVEVDLGEFRADWKGERIAGRVVSGRLKPYPDRARIARHGLNAEALAYARDPVDAFVLEIQGSGRVRFDDGAHLDIGYAAQNGHVYKAIGKTLIEKGELAKGKATMPAIRAWLAAHPDRLREILDSNPSVVFFRPIKAPTGAQGLALTPRRSLAVDPRFLTLGAPIYVDAEDPRGGRLQRLFVAQDTGGAIRGPVRGDVFWGTGAEAEQAAGAMKSSGRAWILVPADISIR